MNEELLEALKELCEEKGISEDVIFEALDAALVAAYKRNFASAQNAEVKMNRETGEVRVYSRKEVVEEVDADSQLSQISLADAKNINAAYEIGDFVDIEVTPRNFGRIAAMTAKQVVTQRLREAERGIVFSEYAEKMNELVSGSVQRIERGNVFVDIGKIEAILPAKEQPQGEEYQIHQTIRCYVSEVKNGTRGTQIVLSRTHPGLVKKLFSMEVPEIAEGTVQIKSIAREAGSRTKIAVYSEDENVDPQGACIGPKGIRVQRIGDELKNEKIDIVKWSEDPRKFISESLSPAKVISVDLNEEDNTASVVVPEYQLSLAIGKSGQNVRLAARLTGWRIDIISDQDAAREAEEKAAYEEEEALAGVSESGQEIKEDEQILANDTEPDDKPAESGLDAMGQDENDEYTGKTYSP